MKSNMKKLFTMTEEEVLELLRSKYGKDPEDEVHNKLCLEMIKGHCCDSCSFYDTCFYNIGYFPWLETDRYEITKK